MNNLRIPEHLWNVFAAAIIARDDVETAGVILAERLDTSIGTILVARQVHVWPESGNQIRRRDRLQLDPIAINRLTRPARDHNWSIITVHSHPGAATAAFSGADDAGDARLMPCFAMQVPASRHGSMVIAASGRVCARLFDGDAHDEPLQVTLVGSRVRRLEASGDDDDDRRFARQRLALGADGQRQLRSLRIGIVGLGGIGSTVFLQMYHAGIGSILPMDGDLTEDTNLSRIITARTSDAGVTPKVELTRRYADEVRMPVEVLPHHGHLVGENELRHLRTCDIIASCVDRYTPRALLNRLAYDACIPIVDHGTAFRVDAAGTIIDDAGRVVVIGPGKPCLGCWGHLDPDALRQEALSAEERESLREEGYISGADVEQPSVIVFNTAVAGAGAVEILRLITGFAGMDAPPKRLAFSFKAGTVTRNGLAGDSCCRICGRAQGIRGSAA